MTLGERALAHKNSRKHKTLCNEKEGGNPMNIVKARKVLQWVLCELLVDLFIYLGFYVTVNIVQVISRRVVGRAEETSTFSLSGFCTVNCRPTASNYQLSHLRPCREPSPGLRGGRRVLPLFHRGPSELLVEGQKAE